MSKIPGATDSPPANPFSATFVTALLLGAALNPVNSTLIATALAPIAHDFGVPAGRTAVLVSVLYLACAVAQPTAGKLSEQLGPRKIFLAGALLVLVGGLLGGLSPELGTLIAARVVIGIGTSAGFPSAMLMVRERAVKAGLPAPPGGVLAGLAVVGLALIAVGPPLGGVLVAAFGWRATFFVNVPFALAAIVLALTGVPRDPPLPRQGARALLDRIDLAGIAGFAVMMTALLVFLLSIPYPRWVALGAAAVAAAAFTLWELHVAHPFFDVRELVSNGPLTLTYLRTALTMLGAYVVLYALPQWLEDAHGYSSEAAGLAIIPMGIVSAAASTWISRRGWIRGPLAAAGAAMAAGGAAMAGLGSAGLPAAALFVACVFGVTLGASIAGGQLALYAQAAADRVGTAAGLLRTFTYLGSIGASVISGLTFRGGVGDPGLHHIGWIVAALGVVVAAITVCDRSLRRPPPADPDLPEARAPNLSEPSHQPGGHHDRNVRH